MPEDMGQAVKNVREGYEAFNRGDFDAAAEHLHPDVVFQRVADVETSLEGQTAEFRFFLDRDEAVAAASSAG